MIGCGKYLVPVINILIGTYTFLTGLHVEQVQSDMFKICTILNQSLLQIVSFFERISCAAPGRSYMYNIAGSWLNKVTYNYWLKMQVAWYWCWVLLA